MAAPYPVPCSRYPRESFGSNGWARVDSLHPSTKPSVWRVKELVAAILVTTDNLETLLKEESRTFEKGAVVRIEEIFEFLNTLDELGEDTVADKTRSTCHDKDLKASDIAVLLRKEL
ncbi:hypothetical protein ABKA04_009609 [Annulohypoxylon sp. FPYF3050]